MDFHWPFLPAELSSDPSKLKSCSPEEFERWCALLTADIPPEYHGIMREQLCDAIAQAHFSLSPSSPAAAELFAFLSAHPHAKALAENWSPVLPAPPSADPRRPRPPPPASGTGFQVHTGKRRCPDDDIYKQFEPLQRNLPRGVVFVRDGGAPRLALFGNRKFFGRQRGDDDDSELCSTALSLEFRGFLNSTKANGECCQVAWEPRLRAWVVGSKNRKILAASAEEAARYADAQAYTFATEMALCFFRQMALLPAERVAQLQQLLALTQLTLNFEYESPLHQHIVHLSAERLVLIGASGIHLRGRTLHPIFATALGRCFGFASVLDDLTTHPAQDLERVCAQIGEGWNTEGSVLVLLDAAHLVLDLVKVKAWWYVLLRAMREKLRRLVPADPDSLRLVQRNTRLRFEQLEVDLRIPPRFVRRYTLLAAQFAAWLSRRLAVPAAGSSSTGIQYREKPTAYLVDKYPVLWLDFLREKGLPSGPSLVYADLPAADALAQSGDESDGGGGGALLPVLLVLQGIPGSGKSSYAARAVEVLQARGVSAVQLAQDDFAHLGMKQSSAACLEATRQYLAGKQHQVVILARNNANIQQFAKYLQFDDYLARILFFCPAELYEREPADFLYMCLASVLHRKHSDAAHPTDEMQDASLALLPLRFLKMLAPEPGAIRTRLLSEGDHPTPELELLKDLMRNTNINSEKLSASALQRLRLDDQAHLAHVVQSYHRGLTDVATDIADHLMRLLPFQFPDYQSYVAIVLDPLSTEALLKQANALAPEPWARVCHHLTLIHSVNFAENPQLWHALLAELKKPVASLHVNRFYLSSHLLCASVEILDDAIRSFVISGHPHVTMALADNTSAVASLRLLQKVSSDPSICQTIEMESPIPISGHIQLIHP